MNKIIINADQGGEIISRHLYGHFAEHLGRGLYDGIWVGEDSPIPNTRGIRNDIVAALQKIQIPNLRWPGGCFADEYHWRDGIGPRSQRSSTINTHWGGVNENNHFGTHEFMELCEQLGCEPYICGNLGSGTIHEMQQWVEYLTSDGKNSITDLRRANGRTQPWKVRFWGVGNENWACGGNMRPEYYADLFRRYATYLRNFGANKLFKIACGANAEDYRWTEVLMRETSPLRYGQALLHGLALHYYTVPGTWEDKGAATRFDERGWFQALKKASFMEELVARHAAIMNHYDAQRRIALIVDEWGLWHDPEPGTNPAFLYQQNTLRDALAAALTLNIFNRHCARVKMANIAQTVNVLQAMALTQGEKMILTPTYHVFEMYKVHHDAVLLPLHLECDEYALAGESLPLLSASASRGADDRIHLSLCNLRPDRDAGLSGELRGVNKSFVNGRILTAPAMNAHNAFDHPEAVRPAPFDGAKLQGEKLTVSLPAKSVVVLELS